MISIETARGPARVHDYRAENATKSLVLTHGAGGGVDAGDLQLLAEHLPPQGVSVHLVEMPWRVAGKKLAPRPAIIDECYTSVLTALSLTAPVVGGRSAGARSACRISSEVGARAVLALSFPLHPPGRPEVTRTAELAGVAVPLLVVQGGRDGFGRPEEFPEATMVIDVPYADHALKVAKKAPLGQDDASALVVEAVLEWLGNLPPVDQ